MQGQEHRMKEQGHRMLEQEHRILGLEPEDTTEGRAQAEVGKQQPSARESKCSEGAHSGARKHCYCCCFLRSVRTGCG
jgi:hypothetical protein